MNKTNLYNVTAEHTVINDYYYYYSNSSTIKTMLG